MKGQVIALALLSAIGINTLAAEDGIPSRSKLNKLGLNSLELASDHAGQEVRGRAFVQAVFRWKTAAGEKAIFDGTNLVFEPGNFAINDTNRGAGVISDGGPFTTGAVQPIVFNFESSSAHQQDVLVNNFVFSEISSSQIVATVIAAGGP